MMNLFVICALIYATGRQVEGATDNLAPSREKCTTQFLLTADRIAAAETNPSSPDFPTLKCFIRCVLDDIGTLNANGTVIAEAAIAAIVEDTVRERLRPRIVKCIGDTKFGGDRCEYAYLVTKCLREADGEAYATLGITGTPKEI